MRPMFLEFRGDLNCYAVDTPYMSGPNLLLAPVFTGKGEATFYVPRDEEGDKSWEVVVVV